MQQCCREDPSGGYIYTLFKVVQRPSTGITSCAMVVYFKSFLLLQKGAATKNSILLQERDQCRIATLGLKGNELSFNSLGQLKPTVNYAICLWS